MSPRAVRRIVIAVCVAGIGGMIAGSIADNNGAAMTAGLVTAVAILCLIVATAVTTSPPAGAEGAAVEVEDAVEGLVAGGADEAEVRELVRRAVRLGRAQ
jgi:multisubunit Na+/H+ antiporter MnhB subunit